MGSSTSTPTSSRPKRPSPTQSSIAVVGSGNLGLVWFTGNDHRLTVEELEEKHPGLVAAVAAHPGVGLLLVRSKTFGAVVFGPNGTRYLDEDRVEGEDPTTLFGPHTIMSLKREDAMVHAPDLLLLSQYDPELGEVAAFEELIGSHGGLGGPQTEPFILHPVEWTLDEEVPLGRTGHLPEHPALAERDRHRAREAAGRRRGSTDRRGQPAGTGRRRRVDRGQDPLRGRRRGLGRAVHRRADRFRAAPAGALAGSRHEVLRAPRARRHVGRRDRGDRHLRRRLGARALRLVRTGRRPADAPGGAGLRARDGRPSIG